jgi:hypothetical protein
VAFRSAAFLLHDAAGPEGLLDELLRYDQTNIDLKKMLAVCGCSVVLLGALVMLFMWRKDFSLCAGR